MFDQLCEQGGGGVAAGAVFEHDSLAVDVHVRDVLDRRQRPLDARDRVRQRDRVPAARRVAVRMAAGDFVDRSEAHQLALGHDADVRAVLGHVEQDVR